MTRIAIQAGILRGYSPSKYLSQFIYPALAVQDGLESREERPRQLKPAPPCTSIGK